MKTTIQAAALALLLAPAALPAQERTFVPGDSVLFYEDFAAPNGSGFRRLRDVSERVAMGTHDGRAFVHVRTPGRFRVPLPAMLPERFTVDFEVFIPGENYVWVGAAGEDGLVDGRAVAYFSPYSLSYSAGGDEGANLEADAFPGGDERIGRVMHLAVQVDGPRARMFVDGVQRLETSEPAFGRSRAVHFDFGGVDDPTLLDQNVPIWITNVRVATHSAPISFEALSATGRVATHGIRFDTGSDRIRPESAPVLASIVALLREHPELRLRVEGHTDDVGDDDANRALSERRAAAVRAHLVAQGIDAVRLESAGLGESSPVSPNMTAEGRQRNRRVELVRLP